MKTNINSSTPVGQVHDLYKIGDVTLDGAVEALVGMGYPRRKAKEIVSKWGDPLYSDATVAPVSSISDLPDPLTSPKKDEDKEEVSSFLRKPKYDRSEDLTKIYRKVKSPTSVPNPSGKGTLILKPFAEQIYVNRPGEVECLLEELSDEDIQQIAKSLSTATRLSAAFNRSMLRELQNFLSANKRRQVLESIKEANAFPSNYNWADVESSLGGEVLYNKITAEMSPSEITSFFNYYNNLNSAKEPSKADDVVATLRNPLNLIDYAHKKHKSKKANSSKVSDHYLSLAEEVMQNEDFDLGQFKAMGGDNDQEGILVRAALANMGEIHDPDYDDQDATEEDDILVDRVTEVVHNLVWEDSEYPYTPIYNSTKLTELEKWLATDKKEDYLSYIKKNYDLPDETTWDEVEEVLGSDTFYTELTKAMTSDEVQQFETDYADISSSLVRNNRYHPSTFFNRYRVFFTDGTWKDYNEKDLTQLSIEDITAIYDTFTGAEVSPEALKLDDPFDKNGLRSSRHVSSKITSSYPNGVWDGDDVDYGYEDEPGEYEEGMAAAEEYQKTGVKPENPYKKNSEKSKISRMKWQSGFESVIDSSNSKKKRKWKHPDEVAKDNGADITCSKQVSWDKVRELKKWLFENPGKELEFEGWKLTGKRKDPDGSTNRIWVTAVGPNGETDKDDTMGYLFHRMGYTLIGESKTPVKSMYKHLK